MARSEPARRLAARLDVVEQAEALIDGGDQLGVGRVAQMLAALDPSQPSSAAAIRSTRPRSGGRPRSRRSASRRSHCSGSSGRFRQRTPILPEKRAIRVASGARTEPRCSPSWVSHSSGSGSSSRRSTMPTCGPGRPAGPAEPAEPRSGTGEQHQIAGLQKAHCGKRINPVHRPTSDPAKRHRLRQGDARSSLSD